MKTLLKEQLNKMNFWMQNNARPYDLAKWDFLFNGKPKENIVTEMLKYQNADGGFGHGFESDIFLPLSAAIPSAEAIFQAYDYELDCEQKWFCSLLDYFENSVQSTPKLWEDAPKEVMDYPHAPWWEYQPATQFSPNPCAIIASALILFGTASQKELGYCAAKKCFDFLIGDALCSEHDCYNLMKLIEKLQAIHSPLVTDEVLHAMKRRIAENVCYDSDKWNEYYPQPLDFADSPESMWREDIQAGIAHNFAYWLESINDHGVWTPNFSWGIDSEAAKQSTKNWTGYITVKRAKILMDYGLLDCRK